MTIQQIYSPTQYQVSGAGPYAFTWDHLGASTVKVLRGDVRLSADQYSVVPSGSAPLYTGGTVTLTMDPLPEGENITIVRETPKTQQANYIPNGPFPAASHEHALDKLTLQTQETVSSNASGGGSTTPVFLSVDLQHLQDPVSYGSLQIRYQTVGFGPGGGFGQYALHDFTIEELNQGHVFETTDGAGNVSAVFLANGTVYAAQVEPPLDEGAMATRGWVEQNFTQGEGNVDPILNSVRYLHQTADATYGSYEVGFKRINFGVAGAAEMLAFTPATLTPTQGFLFQSINDNGTKFNTFIVEGQVITDTTVEPAYDGTLVTKKWVEDNIGTPDPVFNSVRWDHLTNEPVYGNYAASFNVVTTAHGGTGQFLTFAPSTTNPNQGLRFQSRNAAGTVFNMWVEDGQMVQDITVAPAFPGSLITKAHADATYAPIGGGAPTTPGWQLPMAMGVFDSNGAGAPTPRGTLRGCTGEASGVLGTTVVRLNTPLTAATNGVVLVSQAEGSVSRNLNAQITSASTISVFSKAADGSTPTDVVFNITVHDRGLT
jgi:hypothetical protein